MNADYLSSGEDLIIEKQEYNLETETLNTNYNDLLNYNYNDE